MGENSHKSMNQHWADSFLFGGNAEYLDEQYDQFLRDPQLVSDDLRVFFQQIHQDAPKEVPHDDIRQAIQSAMQKPSTAASDGEVSSKQFNVYDFIRNYRMHGHYAANIDPLNIMESKNKGLIQPENYGFNQDDFEQSFNAGDFAKLQNAKLKDIIATLQKIYSGSIGFEYMYVSDADEFNWLRENIEDSDFYQSFSPNDKKRILQDLISANEFERYLHKKYVGQKRFSLEGGDSLIVCMNEMIRHVGANPVEEVVIGMAHRGRLNVLANVVGKPIKKIIEEFDGLSEAELKEALADKKAKMNSGDVKYHMGYSQDLKTQHGTTHVTLAFNPSHLEFVAPVVEGSVRARQQRRGGKKAYGEVLPVILHGDSAFAGQGVVMETINMSQATGYETGGSIHIIINNQVGFTTSDPKSTRSTHYCSDLAKMLEAPIFHVNADDAEAVAFISRLAIDYRMRFNKDVFIDLVCYRKHGHNEADEPSATQPLMYAAIKKQATPARIYADKLVKQNIISNDDYTAAIKAYLDKVKAGDAIPQIVSDHQVPFIIDWSPYLNQPLEQACDTSMPKEQLVNLAQKFDTAIEKDVTIQAQVKKMLLKREEMTAGTTPINWGYAEMLSYLTLLNEGYPVRLSGEDCQRGTFAHRHAVLSCNESGKKVMPINDVPGIKAKLEVYNSILSEAAVMGFDYGYASSDPHSLVIWEAQFGDFANGAQVIIDQFISSGEQKWNRLCGLVLFLPHGYEGMGPEHSSARLERFLQLCAENNMQVCIPTTPAQVYHMLRRQMIRPARKPLITLTPKSLLRHPLAVSSFDELSGGGFQEVIVEIDEIKAANVERVVLCTGKVYYDLLQRRRDEKLGNVAIVRVEQLYPFPAKTVTALLTDYSKAKTVIWCQEEPENQGAWRSMRSDFSLCLAEQQQLKYAGRPASASPAAGHAKLHKLQQQLLVEQALGLIES